MVYTCKHYLNYLVINIYKITEDFAILHRMLWLELHLLGMTILSFRY